MLMPNKRSNTNFINFSIIIILYSSYISIKLTKYIIITHIPVHDVTQTISDLILLNDVLLMYSVVCITYNTIQIMSITINTFMFVVYPYKVVIIHVANAETFASTNDIMPSIVSFVNRL